MGTERFCPQKGRGHAFSSSLFSPAEAESGGSGHSLRAGRGEDGDKAVLKAMGPWLKNCVTLDKWFTLSEPQFLYP